MKKLYVCPLYPGGRGHLLRKPASDVDADRDVAASEGISPELCVRRFGAGRITIRTSPDAGDVATLLLPSLVAAGAGRRRPLRAADGALPATTIGAELEPEPEEEEDIS